MLTGSEIRRKFLDFFIQKGHREVHSSSLVPANDPTLLFTNAGMNQFKDVFLGLEKRDYSRAATSQKCVRAGGKHNDLENVGFTNRHHTFFEMLGNFSFGDYFKKDAIAYAWELITSPEWFGIDKEKLYVTIFKGENGVPRDAEAYDLWLGQGVPKDRIHEFGAKDNFWQMGDTGPCGPCSEIHYDMGAAASDQGHKDCTFGCDCGRYVELWNLVFMQFNRYYLCERDGFPADWSEDKKRNHSKGYKDKEGKFHPPHSDDNYPCLKLEPLPKPSIDTGAGLERIAAVLQGVISNYETDLFTPLIKRAAELTLTAYGRDDRMDASLRIIADHSRAATFLISDNVYPSNEGRGYVLRKILRRAIRHGRWLATAGPFLNQMVFAVRDVMQDAYPELVDSSDHVSRVVLDEEKRFGRTLKLGSDKLLEDLTSVVGAFFNEPSHKSKLWVDAERLGGVEELDKVKVIGDSLENRTGDWMQVRIAVSLLKKYVGLVPNYSGKAAFRIYDTFGMPLDFIQDSIRDVGIAFDEEAFEVAMAEQRERARASWKGAARQTASPVYVNVPRTEFEGYRTLRSVGCKILFVIRDGRSIQGIKAGEEADIVLDRTSFYAESGGQVGDIGWLLGSDHQTVLADVKGCYFPVQGVRAHRVVAKALLIPGNYVDAVVDEDFRHSTMRNHTATHLLQAGLREVLGKHVKQAGSLVAPNHLRFDFSHFTGVAEEELQDIEDIINKEVLRNERVEIVENVPIDVAVNEYHATALFGEKYGDKVRVIKIGDFSTELCGGTHTGATGEIGLIKILKEGSVSSGVRRIEAVTGEGSLRHFRKDHELEGVVAALSSKEAESPAEALRAELEKRDSEIKRLTRELDQARMKSASSSAASATDKVREIRGVKVLAHRVDNLERAQLRTLVDQLRDKLGSGVVVVGSAADGNVSLIAGVTKDLTSRIQAGKVVGAVAEKVGGKGGGRPDLAEAGGKDAAALDSALDSVYNIVESLLA
jgi:alanyl-tRNA synthetase